MQYLTAIYLLLVLDFIHLFNNLLSFVETLDQNTFNSSWTMSCGKLLSVSKFSLHLHACIVENVNCNIILFSLNRFSEGLVFDNPLPTVHQIKCFLGLAASKIEMNMMVVDNKFHT